MNDRKIGYQPARNILRFLNGKVGMLKPERYIENLKDKSIDFAQFARDHPILGNQLRNDRLPPTINHAAVPLVRMSPVGA